MRGSVGSCVIGLAAALCSSLTAAGVQVETDGNATRTCLSDREVVTYARSGTLRVTKGGVLRVLLVGGGGGGGGRAYAGTDSFEGAGGGAGGVECAEALAVEAGEYDIEVGLGGEVNDAMQLCAAGGDTRAFGLTAHGGGFGAKGRHFTAPGSGASGGGATADWDEMYERKPFPVGGQAVYGAKGNLGFAGGTGKHVYYGGGGGGAGGAGSDGLVGSGGIGVLSDITGEAVYYAGGDASTPGKGGLGGGGNPSVAGADGRGGGGGSGARGGDGVVILSFESARLSKGDDFALNDGTDAPAKDREAFDDAAGGVTNRVERAGGSFLTHTFAENGTFTMAGSGVVEFLLVGGGGGGGDTAWPTANDGYEGAGGGAGGVVHCKRMLLDAGTYEIVVGAGGAANASASAALSNGKDTLAFAYTAYGGGFGAKGLHFTNAAGGGSGGGATVNWSENASKTVVAGGKAVHANSQNKGFAGGDASNPYRGGGGGGAGGSGAFGEWNAGGSGGIGYLCDISGEATYYAGGGASTPGKGGLGGGGNPGKAGTDGLGGGGGSGARGGSGLVIVSHRLPPPPAGMVVIVK